jgi:hypothetical protein
VLHSALFRWSRPLRQGDVTLSTYHPNGTQTQTEAPQEVQK